MTNDKSQIIVKIYNLVKHQIWNFQKRCCSPNIPEWYETKRKTTHVIFWS